MDLSDYILPLLIEKPDDFKPREAKAKFLQICAILSQQAFWLSIDAFLEKHQEAVSAIVIKEPKRGDYSVSSVMTMEFKKGADPKAIAKAQKASASAFSKIRGKIPQLDARGLLRLGRQYLPADGRATRDRHETIMGKALGPQLYAMRKASLEHKELDSMLSETMSRALAGRPRSKSL